MAIASYSALDGVYIIRTSVKSETLDAAQTVRAYKSLSQVELAFRSYKTVERESASNLSPFRTESQSSRLKSVCWLRDVEWQMRKALAPLLFDDEKVTEESAEKSSVVVPSQRSKKARTKAATKKTPEKLPVHSFRTLMADESDDCQK